LPRTILLPW